MRLRAAAVFALLITNACSGGDSGPSGPGTPTTGSVRGTVSDQSGAPVPAAAVSLSATGQTTRNTITGGDGSYTFSSVTPGAYTVTITAPQGFTGSGTANVTVVAGQQANATTVTLNRNPQGPAPPSVAVSMTDNAFTPQSAEVAINGTVTWTNNGGTAHNATGTGGINTGNMNPGASRDQVMATAGTFNYNCTLHSGMSGTIIVR